MTSSDQENASEVLGRILMLISEDRQQALIDAPLDAAMAAFKFDAAQPFTHRYFNETIAGLMVHLHRWGLRAGRTLTPTQGLAEAVHLLQLQPDGYELAYLDSAQNGMNGVLTQLASYLKAQERHKYVRWVFLSELELRDWEMKCHLARIILRLRPELSAVLPLSSPVQLANHCQELIDALIQSDRFFSNLSASLFHHGPI